MSGTSRAIGEIAAQQLNPLIHPPAGYTEDAEIQAIRGCLAHLNKLPEPVRGRVLRYLTDRLGT